MAITRPNILLIIVDQMRYPRFSYGKNSGFAQPIKDLIGITGDSVESNPYAKYFPGFCALRKPSVVLRNHTIASSACIPSRATIMTGQYGSRTGVTQTDGLFKSGDAASFPWLPADGVPTLGDWFRAAGYATHYFGKWHVSNPPEHNLEAYGFQDWELSYPEPHGSEVNNLGTYRDHQFSDLIAGFLRRQGLGVPWDRERAIASEKDPNSDVSATLPPWFAVASFTNPHDIAAYPGLLHQMNGSSTSVGSVDVPSPDALSAIPTGGTIQIPLNPQNFPQENASAAVNQGDPLSTKPDCQFDYSYKAGLALAAKTGFGIAEQNLPQASKTEIFEAAVAASLQVGVPFKTTKNPEDAALKFLQYYAYLHHIVDQHIARTLAVLEETGLAEKTIVVFLADHGEYGAAHGMMMEKWHSAYQEVVHVPMLVHGTLVEPSGGIRSIEEITSHVDIVPTLLGLAGINAAQREQIRDELSKTHAVPPLVGVDLSPLIRGGDTQITNPDGSVRQGVLFATDDMITEPLPYTGDPHEDKGEEEYQVFRAAVRRLQEDGSVPAPGLADGPVVQPAHVRAIRSGNWKLVRYFDPDDTVPIQWELYDLAADPNECVNLVVYNAPSFPDVIPEADFPPGLNMTRSEVGVQAIRLRDALGELEYAMLEPWEQ